MFHRCRHCIDMPWRAAYRLSDHAPFGVKHSAGEILAFAHDGAKRGSNERVLLLVRHGEKPVPNDLQSHWIYRFNFHP